MKYTRDRPILKVHVAASYLGLTMNMQYIFFLCALPAEDSGIPLVRLPKFKATSQPDIFEHLGIVSLNFAFETVQN